MTPPLDAPHAWRHIPPRHHAVAEALAGAETQRAIAERMHKTIRQIERTGDVIKAEMYLDGKAWRVAWVRVFYGLDRCWCEQ